jgi:hypothetical protein
MGRPLPILRCRCARCAIERRNRFLAILFICTALAASFKLLLEEHTYFHASQPSSNRVVGKLAHGELEFSAGDRSPETIGLPNSSSFANSYSSEAKPSLPDPCLSRERFNAALAAGLIDPSRIELPESAVPQMSLAKERAFPQTWRPVMTPIAVQGTELQAPSVKFATVAPMGSAPSNPTKTMEAIQRPVTPISKIASLSPNQASKAEPAAPRRPEASPTSKHFSVGLISKAGVSSAENSSEETKSRGSALAAGAIPESPSHRKTDDRNSQSRDLTENLQRFASDFVRANQNDNFAEQHRFFADSVHFYREGDLSLAGVEAATRRYRREQLSKRSEVAEPAAATGPVNGGFFVIDQPVRWTQSEGTKVKQGRSVLRLRVLPINHGGWKITSIDEVGK